MNSKTAKQDQFKIALAYLAKLQSEKKFVSPQVERAFLTINGGKQ